MGNRHDVPGTSKQAVCKQKKENDEYCLQDAHDFLVFTKNILGKEINFRVPVCPDHLATLQDKNSA